MAGDHSSADSGSLRAEPKCAHALSVPLCVDDTEFEYVREDKVVKSK